MDTNKEDKKDLPSQSTSTTERADHIGDTVSINSLKAIFAIEDSEDQIRAEQLYNFIEAMTKIATENPTAKCLSRIHFSRYTDHGVDPFAFYSSIYIILENALYYDSEFDIKFSEPHLKSLLARLNKCRKAALHSLGEVAESIGWIEFLVNRKFNVCPEGEMDHIIMDAKEFGLQEGRPQHLKKYREFVRFIRRIYRLHSFCPSHPPFRGGIFNDKVEEKK